MENSSWTTKLLTLDKRVKAFTQGYRQNIALLGNDPGEISYLLRNYLQFNKSDEITYIHATTAYVGRREFFKAIASSILSSYTHKLDNLDSLINCAAPVLSATTDFIKDCLQKRNLSFLDALELINKFINESNRHCILIIEEFLGLEELFKNFYQDFSKFILLQRNCMLVLTSSYTKSAQKVLATELNLLFGNFEKVFLNENTFLNNFLYFKSRLLPINPSPFFLSFFINIIGSNITYYDFISKTIRNKYLANDEEKTLVDIIEDKLYLPETYFFQKFIKKIDLIKFHFKDCGSVLKLLFALSEGYLRKSELTGLGIYDSKELSTRLQKLCDLNYVQNFGNIYKIKDSLFSFWLVTVFKLYFSSPILDQRQQKMLCRKKLEETITIFKEEFFKGKLKKLLQLFASFKDDTLWLGKNKYRLPLIENAKIISDHKRDFHLLIAEGKRIVFAGIKERNTQENDIFEFIEKGANVKGKGVKKIFISLNALPPTVRLIAKNNKLIIWDVNEVNQLLNIYNKPIISCASE